MTPAQARTILEGARAALAAGQLDRAMSGFEAVLRTDPGHPVALSGRAGVLFQQHRDAAALECLRAALQRLPDDPVLLRERGDILLALEHHAEALESYEHAIAVNYNTGGAMYGAGLALLRLGRPAEALARFDVVAQRGPDWPPGIRHRALALFRLARFEEALALYDRLLGMVPRDPEVMLERANTLQGLGRDAEAVAAYDQALVLRPDDGPAVNNRGVSRWRIGQHAEAGADFRRAAELAPDLAAAHANVGMAREEFGQTEAARDAYARALALSPDELVARLGSVSSCLPPVRDAAEDLDTIRACHQQAMDALFDWADSPARALAVAGAVAPFNLAYHDRDNREAIARHGAHCVAAMARWSAGVGLPAPTRMPDPPGGRRIRLGIVSSHFWTHSVWLAIVRGWIRHMDPARFEIHLFHTGTRIDRQTEWARENVAAFTHGLRGEEAWARAILAWQPDVLVYPDVGMEPLPMRLASLRLAPAQAASWGHPETTGLPTLDYFVSAAALEPPGAQAFYTETLVQLPRLGCSYSALPVTPEPPDLRALGLRGDVPLLICPGTPFKYAPEHDRVLARLARRIGSCQLVFFSYLRSPALSERLLARLHRAFDAEGADFAEDVRLVPWQLTPWFYGLMQRADVFLDTIGFSGFNTAIQAIECGLPVVTVEGRFMRGRLASGILRQMGMDDLVAADTDAFVEIVARLATDRDFNHARRADIAARRGALFDDVETVRAFETFLEGAAAQPIRIPAR